MGHIVISGKAALVAVVMAAMVFAVSNLLFLGDREVDMSVYYIRTLVDICGVLIRRSTRAKAWEVASQ